MPKWYLIDNCLTDKGQIFETLLSADKEEALRKARSEWDRMSARDQNACDAFYVGLADATEDGCVDYDTMTEIVNIK